MPTRPGGNALIQVAAVNEVELSPSDAGVAAPLIKAGGGYLKVSVFPWGAEFALVSREGEDAIAEGDS